MRFLIDTHVFLWAAAAPEKLSPDGRSILEDPANEIYVSAAAAWEVAIKYAKGHLRLPLDPATYVPSRLKTLGFRDLPISLAHALATAALPALHNDPFDRIMIAQAQCESLTFVTRDPFALAYLVVTRQA